MTYTVIVNDANSDEEHYADFASGRGLEEFRAALASTMTELDHLLEHGWADDLPLAVHELTLLKDHAPHNVAKSAEIVLEAISESGLRSGVLTLTNGISNLEDDSEKKSLGEHETILEMLIESIAALGEKEPSVRAVAEQVEAIVQTLLGENPKYAAVPGWNQAGAIDQFIAESEDIDNADPRERLRLFVSEILKEAIESTQENSVVVLRETLDYASQMLTGVDEYDLDEDMTRTMEYMTKPWGDYP